MLRISVPSCWAFTTFVSYSPPWSSHQNQPPNPSRNCGARKPGTLDPYSTFKVEGSSISDFSYRAALSFPPARPIVHPPDIKKTKCDAARCRPDGFSPRDRASYTHISHALETQHMPRRMKSNPGFDLDSISRIARSLPGSDMERYCVTAAMHRTLKMHCAMRRLGLRPLRRHPARGRRGGSGAASEACAEVRRWRAASKWRRAMAISWFALAAP